MDGGGGPGILVGHIYHRYHHDVVRAAPAMVHPPSRRLPRYLKARCLISLLLGVLAGVMLVPELFGLAEKRPFVQLVAFRPAASVGLLSLAAVMVLIRRQWWPTALALGLVSSVTLGAIAPRAIAGPPPGQGQALTVLSSNVYNGHANVMALATTIRDAKPDVVVLSEAGERFRRLLAEQLTDLGYRSWVNDPLDRAEVHGIVILAAPKLGAVTAEPIDLDTTFQWMQLSGGTLGSVRVVAVHVVAPRGKSMRRWSAELGMLRQWCPSAQGATIIVGDFNATLDQAPLHSAIGGCTDAAADRGQGLVATWPSSWPRWFGVQIDHVFTAGGPRPARVEILDLPGSDHRALLVQTIMPNR